MRKRLFFLLDSQPLLLKRLFLFNVILLFNFYLKTGEKIIARVTLAFKNNYSLSTESVIRGHHIYKLTWNPYKGEKLVCNHDKQEDAKIFEEHAVGTYKDCCLVGHVPIELFFLFCKLSRREITKYLLKSLAEENWKMG